MFGFFESEIFLPSSKACHPSICTAVFITPLDQTLQPLWISVQILTLIYTTLQCTPRDRHCLRTYELVNTKETTPHNPAVRLKKLKTEWEVAVDPNSKGFLGVSSNNTDSKGVQNWYKDGVEIEKAHKWRVKEGPFEKVTLSKM